MSHQVENENGIRQAETGKPGRRERRSEETREKIYRVALRLFAERGFSATTIESITQAADVGKGTFFNYFESKESLLLEFRERQMGRIRQGVAKSLDYDVPLATLLYELAVSLNEETGKSPALFQSLLTAAFSSEMLRKRMSEGLAQGRQMLSGLIAQRQQRGEIRTDLEPEVIAHAFQRLVFGNMVIWSLSPINPFEENLKKMTDVFLNGVRSR
jgi:AcrR family transcriptional regulator